MASLVENEGCVNPYPPFCLVLRKAFPLPTFLDLADLDKPPSSSSLAPQPNMLCFYLVSTFSELPKA